MENLLSQVDQEGYQQLFLEELIDHRASDDAIKKGDGTYTSSSGVTHMKMITNEWDLYVQWKDSITNWVALKGVKNTFLIELPDYTISNNIKDEPVFAW